MWGARNCLIDVDTDVIDCIMDELQPEFDRLSDWGVPAQFSRRAEAACQQLNIDVQEDLTLTSVWLVFLSLLPEIDWED